MSQPTKTHRDPTLDNARAVLIALVVIGHAIARADESALADAGYTWIYAFHMPAFALVSGYLARNFTGTARDYMKLAAGLLIPYFVFQLLHAIVRWVTGDGFSVSFFKPDFAMWFLLALFTWRLLVPLIKVVRASAVVAVAASLLAPLASGVGHDWALNRTLSFLPFFALGVLITRERMTLLLEWSRRTPVRITAALVVLASLAAAVLLRDIVPRGASQMDASYAAMDQGVVDGMLFRLAQLVVALILTAALVALTPQKETFFTGLGQRTLYVYLLHGLVLAPLLPVIRAWDADLPGVLLLVVLATLLTLLLGSTPVRAVTRWVVEPPAGWAFRSEDPATRPAPRSAG